MQICVWRESLLRPDVVLPVITEARRVRHRRAPARAARPAASTHRAA
jgi:hypothetical protein